MNYKGKRVAITGSTGFIGRALRIRLEELGARVSLIYRDVREPETFAELDHSYQYLFHFAAPSSQILFERQPQYCADVTITGFINALNACEPHGIKLIYPSTGLLSQQRYNAYAMCKSVLENMAANTDALGIRLFAAYGPGEAHKRDYASVPYLFARAARRNQPIVLFGDGKQVRDFIYIDDAIQGILTLADESNEKIADLGSGYGTTFLEIIDEIKSRTGSKVDVIKIDSPAGYVKETHSTANGYYEPQTPFWKGFKNLIDARELSL